MPIILRSSKPVVRIGYLFRQKVEAASATPTKDMSSPTPPPGPPAPALDPTLVSPVKVDAATQTDDIPGLSFTPFIPNPLAPVFIPSSPVKGVEVANLIYFDESGSDSAPEEIPEQVNVAEASPAKATAEEDGQGGDVVVVLQTEEQEEVQIVSEEVIEVGEANKEAEEKKVVKNEEPEPTEVGKSGEVGEPGREVVEKPGEVTEPGEIKEPGSVVIEEPREVGAPGTEVVGKPGEVTELGEVKEPSREVVEKPGDVREPGREVVEKPGEVTEPGGIEEPSREVIEEPREVGASGTEVSKEPGEVGKPDREVVGESKEVENPREIKQSGTEVIREPREVKEPTEIGKPSTEVEESSEVEEPTETGKLSTEVEESLEVEEPTEIGKPVAEVEESLEVGEPEKPREPKSETVGEPREMKEPAIEVVGEPVVVDISREIGESGRGVEETMEVKEPRDIKESVTEVEESMEVDEPRETKEPGSEVEESMEVEVVRELEETGEDMKQTASEGVEVEGDNDNTDPAAAANGNELENKALGLIPHSFPDGDILVFEVSCVVCCEAVSLSRVACPFGHSVCPACMRDYQFTACPAKIYMDDGVSEGSCELELETLDEAVKRTPYCQFFEEEAIYHCGAKEIGCKVTLPGKEMGYHERVECRYRYMRYCGFQKHGCTASFKFLDAHILHLLKDHGVPVLFREAHFLVRYDREEYVSNDNGMLNPVIRGFVETRRRKLLIALVAEDLKDDKGLFTRIRLVNVSRANEPVRMYAKMMTIVYYDIRTFDMSVDLENVQMELAILPSFRDLVDMEDVQTYNGRDAYLDVSENDLCRFKVEKEGQKFFHLLIRPEFLPEVYDDEEDDEEETNDGNGEESEEEGAVVAVEVVERRKMSERVPAPVPMPSTSQRKEEVKPQPQQEEKIDYDAMDDIELEEVILDLDKRWEELAPELNRHLDEKANQERKEKKKAIRKLSDELKEKIQKRQRLFTW